MMSLESLSFFIVYTCAATSAWLATYVVHSTLIIGGVAAINRWWGLTPERREMAWKVALVGGVVTATFVVTSGLGPLMGQYETAALVEASWTTAPMASPILRVLPSVLVALWATYASLVLLRVGYVTMHARRGLGQRAPADPTTRELVMLVAQRMAVTRPVQVTVSDELVSPVVLGASEITLPRRMLNEFTPEEQRSVIGHELAHLARRDPRWLMLAATIESLFFFQLLNRLARIKWQEQAEYVCDEMAAGAEGARLPLARSLARVAEWSSTDSSSLMAPALTELRSTLLDRVQRLLASDQPTRTRSGPRFILVMVVLIIAVVAGSPAFVAGPVRGWGRPAFQWTGSLARGQNIEVQGVIGNIHAVSTEASNVTVQATRHGRSTTPDIRFEVVGSDDGATVCVLYPTPAATLPNTCVPGRRAGVNTPANDVAVEFVVHVPPGVGLIASSSTGHITAETLRGPVSAYSSSGDVDLALAAADWSGVREVESKSGDVTISLPPLSDLELSAITGTGSIRSDFALGQRYDSLLDRLRIRGSLGSSAHGVIGHGGRTLRISTIAGNITIKGNRKAAQEWSPPRQ